MTQPNKMRASETQMSADELSQDKETESQMPEDESLQAKESDSRMPADESQATISESQQMVTEGATARRGIYGSKDVPVALLNRLIVGAIVVTVMMIVVFGIKGGFTVSFDTDGGSRVEQQVVRHGQLLQDPAVPVKEGFIFIGWSTHMDGSTQWNWSEDIVAECRTMFAMWES